MAAMVPIPTSSTSRPTSSSSSSLVLLDLADELWFYHSVLPLSAIAVSFPCFPLFSPPSPLPLPDSSTLIAECMYDGDPALLSSSSSSSPPPPTDPEPQTLSPSWYLPALGEAADHKEIVYFAHNHGYPSMSDSDEDGSDEGYYGGHSFPAAGQDEEAYHYYTADSDWDDEDAHNGYPAYSDCEDDHPSRLMKEDHPPTCSQKPHAHLEAEAALSGIYDVAVLLKDQHYQETEQVTENLSSAPASAGFRHEPKSQRSALPHFQVSSDNDEEDMKESLKVWAHAVALTLPWNAAAHARLLL